MLGDGASGDMRSNAADESIQRWAVVDARGLTGHDVARFGRAQFDHAGRDANDRLNGRDDRSGQRTSVYIHGTGHHAAVYVNGAGG